MPVVNVLRHPCVAESARRGFVWGPLFFGPFATEGRSVLAYTPKSPSLYL